MKSKIIQELVEAKAAKGESAAKIFEDLMGQVSKRTIERSLQSLRQHPSLFMTRLPGRPRSTRTPAVVKKIQKMAASKARQGMRRIAKAFQIHRFSVQTNFKKRSWIVPIYI